MVFTTSTLHPVVFSIRIQSSIFMRLDIWLVGKLRSNTLLRCVSWEIFFACFTRAVTYPSGLWSLPLPSQPPMRKKAPFPPRREPPKNTPFGESANTMSAEPFEKVRVACAGFETSFFARPSPSHSLASLPSVSGKKSLNFPTECIGACNRVS